MQYNDSESKIIEGFRERIISGQIIPKNRDFPNKKSETKYNRYLDDIKKLQPKEHFISEFKNISQKDTIYLSAQIITLLFGQKIIPLLPDFFKTIVSSKSNSILDGVCLTIEDLTTNKITNLTSVPSLNKTSTIITIVHEFIHYYFKLINIDFNKKMYYEEIFSIYAEKVACSFLEKNKVENNLLKRVEETRLESIYWHYFVHKDEVEFMLAGYKKCRATISSNPASLFFCNIVEQSYPIIKTSDGEKILSQYFKNLRESYGIGNLFAESLFHYYEEDSSEFLSKLRALAERNISVEDILKYYSISTTNPQTYTIASENAFNLLKK